MSIALQSAMPLLAVAKSVSSVLKYHKHKLLTFKATVHEDNQGVLILANLESSHTTLRWELYALKLHWFRSQLKPKEIKTIFIPTLQQKADLFFLF